MKEKKNVEAVRRQGAPSPRDLPTMRDGIVARGRGRRRESSLNYGYPGTFPQETRRDKDEEDKAVDEGRCRRQGALGWSARNALPLGMGRRIGIELWCYHARAEWIEGAITGSGKLYSP